MHRGDLDEGRVFRVKEVEISVPAADVRDDHHVIPPAQRVMQFADGIAIICLIRFVGHQPVAGAVQRTIITEVIDVVIPAGRRVARPLIRQDGHIAARLMETANAITYLLPVRLRDLEIIGTVRDEIERGHISAKCQIFFDRPRADCGSGLPVDVAPKKTLRWRGLIADNRVADSFQAAAHLTRHDSIGAGSREHESVKTMRAPFIQRKDVGFGKRNALRSSGQFDPFRVSISRIAIAVLCHHSHWKWLARHYL